MTSEVSNPAITGDVVVFGKASMTSVPRVVSIESVVVSDSIFPETRILLCVRCVSLGNIVCDSLGATVRFSRAGLVSAPVLIPSEVAIPDVSVGKVLAAE